MIQTKIGAVAVVLFLVFDFLGTVTGGTRGYITVVIKLKICQTACPGLAAFKGRRD